MMPFCGYSMPDYWAHWLAVGDGLDSTTRPLIFQVNWFRKGADGKFLWPGYGDNSRVVAWIAGHPEGDRLIVSGDRVDAFDAPRYEVDALPDYTALTGLRLAPDGSLVVIAASFKASPSIVRVRIDDVGNPRSEVLVAGQPLPLTEEYLPAPELIEFPTGPGGEQRAYGLFYAPAHADITLPDGELPPVIVMVHGGPTGQAGRQYQAADRFWTSRGFALLDLDYRGSSGYGRAYRNLLRGNWCTIDVEDAAGAVAELVRRGLVDGRRALIRGGSAGGTTTLLALALTDTFATGADLYGVADLAALITDDHKFESRYTFQLIGPYPQAKDVYEQRSPINHVDKLHTPLIVFQGLDDMVVPPAHSERIVDAVAARGLPVGYVAYPGEGHGFRRAENRVRTMEAELWFYGHVLGFTPADQIEPVPLTGRTR
jgi:dipeptidyl aminopeptidase/acylaminoacyl peptidase